MELIDNGNDTAVRLPEQAPMTRIIFTFEGNFFILEDYGKVKAILHKNADWEEKITLFLKDPATAKYLYPA